MNKIARNVFMQDAAPVPDWHRHRYIRDTMLTAVPVGKVVAGITKWQGDLKPLVDSRIDEIEPLMTPFTLGRVLHAEPSSETLRMAQTWTGDLVIRLDDVAREYKPNGPWNGEVEVDLTNLRTALSQMYAAMGTKPFDASEFQASLRSVKDASDAVSRKTTADSSWFANPRAATGAAIRRFAEAEKQRWCGKEAVTRDNSIRDALHTATHAKDARTQLESLNQANRLFWSGREQR